MHMVWYPSRYNYNKDRKPYNLSTPVCQVFTLKPCAHSQTEHIYYKPVMHTVLPMLIICVMAIMLPLVLSSVESKLMINIMHKEIIRKIIMRSMLLAVINKICISSGVKRSVLIVQI